MKLKARYQKARGGATSGVAGWVGDRLTCEVRGRALVSSATEPGPWLATGREVRFRVRACIGSDATVDDVIGPAMARAGVVAWRVDAVRMRRVVASAGAFPVGPMLAEVEGGRLVALRVDAMVDVPSADRVRAEFFPWAKVGPWVGAADGTLKAAVG